MAELPGSAEAEFGGSAESIAGAGEQPDARDVTPHEPGTQPQEGGSARQGGGGSVPGSRFTATAGMLRNLSPGQFGKTLGDEPFDEEAQGVLEDLGRMVFEI